MRISILFENGNKKEIYNVYGLETRGNDVVIMFRMGKSSRTVFFDIKTIKILSIIPNLQM